MTGQIHMRPWRAEAKARRVAAGMSVAELAEAAHRSPSTIRAIEDVEGRPDHTPSFITTLTLVGALDWPLGQAIDTIEESWPSFAASLRDYTADLATLSRRSS